MTNYKQMGEDLGELLDSKQRAYGNVFSATPAIIGLLFPGGIPVLAYRDVLTITRILDKIGRICTAAGKGDPMGEDPWRDIAGYAMLALGQREEQQQKDELDTEAYLNAPGPEPSDTVDDEVPEKKEPAVPPMRYRVSYGDPEGTMTTWGWYDSRREALEAAERCREEHPEPAIHVEDMRPDHPPSNEWVVTWASENYGPYIEAVFSTRGQAEERCGEKRARMPGLTWRVCRVDEVGV